MRRAAAAVLALALVASPRAARADDVVAARKSFADGVRLYQAGDYEGALRLFREANAAHHAPAILYNVGLAEEKLGHPQAAVDAYESYVGEAGDGAEFSGAAIAAIAQVKARSTKLRVETKPPGARVFVDGTPLPDLAPATLLVGPGHHVVIAQGDGWREEKDLEAKGGAESLTVSLAQPAPVAPAPVAPAPVVPAPVASAPVGEPPRSVSGEPAPPAAPAPSPAPEDLVWGAAFAFVPAYMLGVTTPQADNSRGAVSIVAGPMLDLGYAITDKFEFIGRGFVGVGPDGHPSYSWWIGPGLSFAVHPRLWLGASFIGGDLETKAQSPKVRYGTDIVFGANAELNIVVLKKPAGEWLAGIQPAFLLTEMHNDNTTFFFPVTFGYRGY